MIVTCGNCDTQFRLDDSKLKPSGLRVRCSICKTAFFVEPPDSDEDVYDRIAAEAVEDPSAAPDTTFDPEAWGGEDEPGADGPLDPWEPENDWEFVDSQDAQPAPDAPVPVQEDSASDSEHIDVSDQLDPEAIAADSDLTDLDRTDPTPGIDLDFGADQDLGMDVDPGLDVDPEMDLDPGVDLDPDPPGGLDDGASYAADVAPAPPASTPSLAVTVPDLELGDAPEFDLDPGPLGDPDDGGIDLESAPDPAAALPTSSEEPSIGQPSPLAEAPRAPAPAPVESTANPSPAGPMPEAGAPTGIDAPPVGATATTAMSAPTAPSSDLDGDDEWDILEGLGSPGPVAPASGAAPAVAAPPVAAAEGRAKKSRVARRMADAALPSLPRAWSGERWTFVRRSALAIGWIVVGAVSAASLAIGLAPSLAPGGGASSLVESPALPAGIDGRSVRARWIENAAGGWVLVVSGQQRAHAGWEGRYAVVRPLDADGNVLDVAPAAVGPGMPDALLREQDPGVLSDGQRTAAHRQAWLPPADRSFHAVLTRVPAAAQSFEFDVAEAPPLAVPDAVEGTGAGLDADAEKEIGAGEEP